MKTPPPGSSEAAAAPPQRASHRIRSLRRAGRALTWFLVWASLTLLITGIGIRLLFGTVTVDQMLLNLVAIQTDGGGGSALLLLAIVCIAVLPLALTLAVARLRARRLQKLRYSRRLTHRTRHGARLVSILLAAGVIVMGTTAFRTTVKLDDFLAANQSTADIGDYYTAPVVTDDTHKRNIVIIYLESGEATLANDTLFEKDMLAPIAGATEGWQSIENYRQYAGGGWTMAGIVSTQCGIPLKGKITASGGEIVHELMSGLDAYLPNETCLGDVLAEHGYRSVFMGGANPGFAAKDQFLSDHGYAEEYGLEDWRAAGEPDSEIRPDWGLSDARLMVHAEQKVTELHEDAEASGRPFNLSLLTLDTHEPAHVYDSCDVDTDEEMTSIYVCSMEAVAGFMRFMEDQGYLEDTAVVVMGDHLKQLGTRGAFHDELIGRSDRTIFNRVWIPKSAKHPRSEGELRSGSDQLSMYPTLLEAAGLKIRDGEAGLGVSAFTTDIPADSALSLSAADYEALLKARSDDFFARAWGD
ncbi:sulfatase-like hydrolase/transferase [Leucobacter sp. USHLN153]|uniref:sulfatase-like hydrolase/transferase n=1 Tax=Leucobacter sp. USHLN153 TaxID=3081268 RepID=UPI0030191782